MRSIGFLARGGGETRSAGGGGDEELLPTDVEGAGEDSRAPSRPRRRPAVRPSPARSLGHHARSGQRRRRMGCVEGEGF
jgi:hypothetical protein